MRSDNGSSSVQNSDRLIFGMLATFVFGLVAITMMMGMMKVILGLPVFMILACMLVPFSIMVAMEVVFIRLLLRRSETAKPAELSKPQVTNELNSAQPRSLPEPIHSVTEHTTRAFEPVLRDKE
jgi:uncharacterized membrane protein YhdT